MFARLLPALVTVGIAITALVLAWPQLFGVARAPVVAQVCVEASCTPATAQTAHTRAPDTGPLTTAPSAISRRYVMMSAAMRSPGSNAGMPGG